MEAFTGPSEFLSCQFPNVLALQYVFCSFPMNHLKNQLHHLASTHPGHKFPFLVSSMSPTFSGSIFSRFSPLPPSPPPYTDGTDTAFGFYPLEGYSPCCMAFSERVWRKLSISKRPSGAFSTLRSHGREMHGSCQLLRQSPSPRALNSCQDACIEDSKVGSRLPENECCDQLAMSALEQAGAHLACLPSVCHTQAAFSFWPLKPLLLFLLPGSSAGGRQ